MHKKDIFLHVENKRVCDLKGYETGENILIRIDIYECVKCE